MLRIGIPCIYLFLFSLTSIAHFMICILLTYFKLLPLLVLSGKRIEMEHIFKNLFSFGCFQMSILSFIFFEVNVQSVKI